MNSSLESLLYDLYPEAAVGSGDHIDFKNYSNEMAVSLQQLAFRVDGTPSRWSGNRPNDK